VYDINSTKGDNMDASLAFQIIENIFSDLQQQFIILIVLMVSQVIFYGGIIIFVLTKVKAVDYYGTEFVFDSQLNEKNPTVTGYADKVSDWSVDSYQQSGFIN